MEPNLDTQFYDFFKFVIWMMSCLLRHAFMHKNSTSNTWQGVVRCLGLTPSRTLAAPVIRKPLLRVKKIYSLQMNSVFVKFHVNVHHIVTLYTSACHLSGHCNEKGCIATLSILPQSDSWTWRAHSHCAFRILPAGVPTLPGRTCWLEVHTYMRGEKILLLVPQQSKVTD